MKGEDMSIESLDMRTRLAAQLKRVRVGIRYLIQVVRDLHGYRDKLSCNLNEITESIIEKTKSLPEDVDIYASSLVRNISEENEKESRRITDRIDKFDQYTTAAKDVVIQAEELLQAEEEIFDRRAAGLISRLREIEINIPEFPSDRFIYLLSPYVVNIKSDNIPAEASLGCFDKARVPWRIEVRRIASFRPDQVASARVITSICPVSEDEAWVTWTWGPQLHLVDKLGQVKRSIDIGCKVDDVCVDCDGNLVVSCHEKRCIKFLDSNYEVKKTIEVGRVPRGLKYLSNNELVVCAVENLHHRNGDQSGILHVDPESNQVATSASLMGDQHVLQPWRIAVNCNGDLCVSDRNKGCVLIFDKNTGELKTTYSGPNMSTRHAFAPHGISCDRFGQIFVVDYTNHTVHVLDPLGRFRGFLIMDTELEKMAIFMGTSSPFSIGIDKAGDVWVGNKYGFVTILRYIM